MLRATFASKKMEEEEEENEGLRTVECLRGRLLAERQVSRSAKQEAELLTIKMEELESQLKEEIRLREKAEKRLKFLMKKLEFIKGSQSLEGSERLMSSSEVSCMSSVSTSASKEEDDEEETHENRAVEEEEKTNKETENAVSMEDFSSPKLKNVIASTSSHEEETQPVQEQAQGIRVRN